MQIDNNEETNLEMPATTAEETSQEKGSQYVEETVIQTETTTPDQEGHHKQTQGVDIRLFRRKEYVLYLFKGITRVILATFST